MPYRIMRFETTPNPNALKCHLDHPLPATGRSFRTPGEGAGDPIAAPLFSICGVTGLLIMGDWLTVNKDPDAKWPDLKRDLKRALDDIA